MSGFEITCANRNQAGLIVRVGGADWSLSIHEAVMKIMTAQVRLYIEVDGKTFDVGVRGEGSNAYLMLERDETPLHTLIGLPSC